MNDEWLPFVYRGFYDVPRAIVVEPEGESLLLDCPFDEATDDYPPFYVVYRLSPEGRDKCAELSWIGLEHLGAPVGRVQVRDIQFDASKRHLIHGGFLEKVHAA